MQKASDPNTDLLIRASLTSEERRALDALRSELAEARAKIRELQAKLPDQGGHDGQPMILTRPEFNREVARMLAFDERYGGTSSVLYFDFETLDAVAERYGKSVANAAIREITNVLTRSVRGADIVGRLGGNEFGILLVRCGTDHAWQKGKSLATLLSEALIEVHGCKLSVGISYGAYTFREAEDVATGLKEAAQVITRASVL